MVEAIGIVAAIIHHLRQQQCLIRAHISTRRHHVVVSLELMDVAQFIARQPHQGVKPQQAGHQLHHPHVDEVGVTNVCLLVTQDKVFIVAGQRGRHEDGLGKRTRCWHLRRTN